ncbi:KilA-N domain-containing protein [Dyadobacter fermentans]|uniref:KilA domain protein n=1 Tax=Dyadobacter fermentans (strain ATCC 700827 / DSM 18053 / CIP 107007 / KCTC 52180 / NS114) TaxID=471854 RepID=C6VWU6_DYAFD|nr:KilA-N domain-containing protein [Dyadobacter fermentans]ACT96846.1 KilA domain protein [Dyadobacter fermentans DSM 18053]
MKNQRLRVNDHEISVLSFEGGDFISLTDIARQKNAATGLVISHWLSTRFTVEFMGLWELLYNPDFNVTEFGNIKNETGSNSYVLTSKRWVEKTNAIGLVSKPGRYNGGTFAHKDIAFEFASWISPSFKLYLIKEFQRLKDEENKRLELDWDLRRSLAKINYTIQTDAIKENLIPKELDPIAISKVYAEEADILNLALFGITARDWARNNPASGHLRDSATLEQLVVLSNLESINAMLIGQGRPAAERTMELNRIAIVQMKSLLNNLSLQKAPLLLNQPK